MCPITVIIYVLFEDMLVLLVYKDITLSMITVHMCMVWPCHSFVDGHSYKCINVYKKVKLFIHDCLCILMLMYIMLYIMPAYLMLFAALSNAVCLYNAFFFFCYSFLQILFV